VLSTGRAVLEVRPPVNPAPARFELNPANEPLARSASAPSCVTLAVASAQYRIAGVEPMEAAAFIDTVERW
jgi:hypothetical protein